MLILSFVLISFPEIGIVKADGPIYIKADGSVEGTDKIQRNGNVYTFTGNIYGSVVVEKDSIVIDGVGYTLQGNGSGRGVDLVRRIGVTIQNLQIKNFTHGIHQPINATINGNYITNNEYGIFLASNNTITGNTFANNNEGIGLHLASNYNFISGNNITKNNQGIGLWLSEGNIFLENEITANVVNGILVAASSNNTIIGNNITKNAYGIWINQFSVYNNVTGNNITRSEIGIMIEGSLNNTIYNNNLDNQKQVDINDTLADEVISINIWDNGKDGNYWSDYTGTDSDGDGKGDTPYVIDENNQGNYPLVNVIPEFPSWVILPLLFVAALVIIICKKRLPKTPNNQSY